MFLLYISVYSNFIKLYHFYLNVIIIFIGPSLSIIAALPNKKFINYLIYSFIFQTGLMTYGRPELYFLLSPSVFTVGQLKLILFYIF